MQKRNDEKEKKRRKREKTQEGITAASARSLSTTRFLGMVLSVSRASAHLAPTLIPWHRKLFLGPGGIW